jgi:hypothetical protein
MDYDDLAAEIHGIFNPEPDENGNRREWPTERLKKHHGLDFTYMEDWLWEGATSHPNTRLWPKKEPGGDELTRSMDVGRRLFYSALRVFGDSILTYATEHAKRNPSELRFYPPVILTFWSGFEAFVRHSSELMIHTSKELPEAVADYLRDEQTVVDRKGAIKKERKHRPALDRYAVLLQYGMAYKVDRGNKYWQALERARDLRDYYTHLDAMNSRALSSDDVFDFLETVMLSIIWPSAAVEHTLQLGIFDLYLMWDELRDLARKVLPDGHIEQPFFHDWKLDGRPYMFYCPFTNVDNVKFPNSDEERGRPPRQRPKLKMVVEKPLE